MRIGLIDVDAKGNPKFPNLALMRISAYHKAKGDTVEWWWSSLVHYDIVYMSKVFSDDYSPDIPDPVNADKIIKGGTGYCIHLENGKEVFDQSKNVPLPPEMEKMVPDYTIYPQFDFAITMTSRGCPRGCAFCHVAAKEGRCSKKVADVSDFWVGQADIRILDPNILACAEKRDLMWQYRQTGAMLDFTQGLDIRCMNGWDIEDINHMRIRYVHFAWDNPKDDLREKFQFFAKCFRRNANLATVYVLVNFDSTMEENLYRIYTLRDMGYEPYVMVYDKPHAPKEIKALQRWCNDKRIFGKVKRFEEYEYYLRKDEREDRARAQGIQQP